MAISNLAVVIPFFQREEGILETALQSIVAQRGFDARLQVVIVDDGSPIPAADEVRRSGLEGLIPIRILTQKNAGPNEARNAALDALGQDVDVVAYLDSDDQWIGAHLARGLRVIDAGYSAYFANLFHLGDEIDEFEKAKRVRISEHPALWDETLRRYEGDMVRQIVTANIIFMPSLIVDFRKLGKVRFPLAHRHGGGDYLYWLALTRAGATFAFSTEPEVRCGRGVNMWYGSGWGTDGLSRRILDELRFRARALSVYVTDRDTKSDLRSRISGLQSLILLDALHRLRRGKKVDWSVVKSAFREAEVSPLEVGRRLLQSLRTGHHLS